MKKTKHPFWHYLFMVVFMEIINIIWISVGLVCIAAGYSLLAFAGFSFWRVGIGMPLGMIGAGVFMFKLYEIVLVLVNPSRIQVLCKFCNKNSE